MFGHTNISYEEKTPRKINSLKKTDKGVEEIKIELSKEDAQKQCYEEVYNRFIQQDDPIRDHPGRRWVECEIGYETKPNYKFLVYVGPDKVTLGKCGECC